MNLGTRQMFYRLKLGAYFIESLHQQTLVMNTMPFQYYKKKYGWKVLLNRKRLKVE